VEENPVWSPPIRYSLRCCKDDRNLNW